MIFSYKTRRMLRRVGMILLVALLVASIAMVLHMVWLRRFVVYTPQGVRLDLGLSDHVSPGKIPVKPDKPQVPVVYPEETAPAPEQSQQPPLAGFYVTTAQMQKDLEGLRQQIAQLPAGTAILMDVKSYWGYFYYTTNLGPGSNSFLLAQMDAFIAELTQSDLYVIARLPAFRDYEFGLNNTESTLKNKKGYPWEDDQDCYWLDPTDDAALTYMIQIVRELRSLGFDEVVFKDFYVPESSKIVFDTDRKEAVEAAAKTLVSACATDQFTVSFLANTPDLILPEGNCRLYFMDVAAADVQDVLAQVTVTDPAHQVVFLAQTNDTRYNVCGVLRPLELA